MPVTEQTRGMLNADAFAKMKPGVRIVNCARGEIIEEKDLIAAIGIQKSCAARRWMFSPKNLCRRIIRFAQLPNIFLTPHLGASTSEAQEKCGIEVAEIIAAYLLTGEVRNAVNLPFIDAKTFEEVQPYLLLGEKLGKLLASFRPPTWIVFMSLTVGKRARFAEYRSDHAVDFARFFAGCSNQRC